MTYRHDPRCACPGPADLLRSELAGRQLEPCPVHTATAARDAAEADVLRARADAYREVADAARSDRDGGPASSGDPLLDALRAKVGHVGAAAAPAARSDMPLNAPASTFATAMGLPGAGHAAGASIDAPDT